MLTISEAVHFLSNSIAIRIRQNLLGAWPDKTYDRDRFRPCHSINIIAKIPINYKSCILPICQTIILVCYCSQVGSHRNPNPGTAAS